MDGLIARLLLRLDIICTGRNVRNSETSQIRYSLTASLKVPEELLIIHLSWLCRFNSLQKTFFANDNFQKILVNIHKLFPSIISLLYSKPKRD